jgi:hypothetical protein
MDQPIQGEIRHDTRINHSLPSAFTYTILHNLMTDDFFLFPIYWFSYWFSNQHRLICSTMHTCIIFLQTHFLVICEYPIILVLPIYFFYYSWAVLACLICFAISRLRNVAFEKRLCMERGPGLPKRSLPRGLFCLCFNFLSVLIFGWGNKDRSGKRIVICQLGVSYIGYPPGNIFASRLLYRGNS